MQNSGSKGDAVLYNTWLLDLDWRVKRGVGRERGGLEEGGGKRGEEGAGRGDIPSPFAKA